MSSASIRWVWIGAVSVLALAAAGSWLATRSTDTTLTFTLRDAVSGKWVYDARITLGDRVIRSFFQSDNAPVAQTFTGLRPGATVLAVQAPGYQPAQLPVTLSRGANRIAEPIDLVGIEIPDLTEMLVLVKQTGGELAAELRPVDSAGAAVLNHPTLELWLAAMVSIQMDGGQPARSAMQGGAQRGAVVFAGEVPWRWNAGPETLFRYSAQIPGPRGTGARFFVVDLITLVPRPEQATAGALGDSIAQLWQRTNPEQFIAALQQDERFRVFVNTVWNVRFN